MFKGKKLLWNQLGNVFLVLVIIGSASAATVSYAYRNAIVNENTLAANAAAKTALSKQHVPNATEAVVKPTEAATIIGEKSTVTIKEQAVKKPVQKVATQKRRVVAVKSPAIKSSNPKNSTAVSSNDSFHEEDKNSDREDAEDHSDEDSEDSGSDD